jgi:type II secretory pathway component PulF
MEPDMRLRAKSDFFHQLGTLLKNGMPLLRALGVLRKTGGSPGAKRLAERLETGVRSGQSITEILRGRPGFSEFDINILHNAEHSVTLPDILEILANLYENQARLISQTIAKTAYPVFLLHAAIMIPSVVPLFVKEDFGLQDYLLSIAPGLGSLYAVMALVVVFWRLQLNDHPIIQGISFVLDCIPLLGNLRRKQGISQFLISFSLLYKSGVSMRLGYPLAVNGISHPATRRKLAKAMPLIADGVSLTEALVETKALPPDIEALILTGEESGSLDLMLDRSAKLSREQFETLLNRIAATVPVIIYLCVLVYVGYLIITGYTNYFNSVLSVGDE